MIRLHKLLLLVAALTASLSAGAAPLGDDEAVVEATDSVAEPGYNAYTGMPAVDAFINAPTAVFPSIDSMTRMDMADYFTSGSPKPSKNVFKGDCRIVSATPSQMTVSTTDASECELSLLPMAGDTIIMVVTTLQTPTPDSSVKFYTYPDWRPIEKGLFIVPGLDEWTAEGSTARREDLENAVPFILARISYDTQARRLTLENNVGDYLPREANELAKDALKERLVYLWNGHKMVKVKEPSPKAASPAK